MNRLIVAAAALLMVLHFILHVGLGLRGIVPDLATLGLLTMARQVRIGTAAATGFGLGLLEDSLSALAFGASTMALTVVGAVGARTRDLFVGETLTFAAAYLFVGKWVRDLIQWIMTSSELREPIGQALLVDSTMASAYVAMVGVALVRLFGNGSNGGPRPMGGGA